MIQSYFKYLFVNSVQYSDYKILPFVHKLAKIYTFRGRGFHTPAEWTTGYKVINKQVIIQSLIVNTAFYIYDNMKLNEISILNLFEQMKENAMPGSALSARQGSSAVAFIPDQKMFCSQGHQYTKRCVLQLHHRLAFKTDCHQQSYISC